MIELVRGLTCLGPEHHGCVLSIGNFDGVHLGHQALVERVVQKARALSVPATLLTFEPTPLECFAPDRAPARVQSLREKLHVLEKLGVDRLVVIRFSPSFAAMSAEAFVEQLLVQKLGIRHLVIGDDFRFGQGRAGDFTLLQAAAEQYVFSLEASPTVQIEQERVSSTRLRAALGEADLALARRLTERAYVIEGRVQSGLGLGKDLGAATLNIAVRPARALRFGVYVVSIAIEGQVFQAVANFGLRPTVEAGRNPERPLLEVHVLNAVPPSLIKRVSVTFQHFLRAEKRFANLDELKAQIAKDVELANLWFADNLGQQAGE